MESVDRTEPAVPGVDGEIRWTDVRVVQGKVGGLALEPAAARVAARVLAEHAGPLIEFRRGALDAVTTIFRRRVRHSAERGHHVPGLVEFAARLEVAGGDRVWMARWSSGENSVSIWFDDAEEVLGCLVHGPLAAE